MPKPRMRPKKVVLQIPNAVYNTLVKLKNDQVAKELQLSKFIVELLKEFVDTLPQKEKAI